MRGAQVGRCRRLGSHATKVVRHSPVPVNIVPRAAVADLAAEAQHSG